MPVPESGSFEANVQEDGLPSPKSLIPPIRDLKGFQPGTQRNRDLPHSNPLRSDSLTNLQRDSHQDIPLLRAAGNPLIPASSEDVMISTTSGIAEASRMVTTSVSLTVPTVPVLVQEASLGVIGGVAIGSLVIGAVNAHSTRIAAKASCNSADANLRNAAIAEYNADVNFATWMLDLKGETRDKVIGSNTEVDRKPIVWSSPSAESSKVQQNRLIETESSTRRREEWEKQNLRNMAAALQKSAAIRQRQKVENVTAFQIQLGANQPDINKLDSRLRRLVSKFNSNRSDRGRGNGKLDRISKGKEPAVRTGSATELSIHDDSNSSNEDLDGHLHNNNPPLGQNGSDLPEPSAQAFARATAPSPTASDYVGGSSTTRVQNAISGRLLLSASLNEEDSDAIRPKQIRTGEPLYKGTEQETSAILEPQTSISLQDFRSASAPSRVSSLLTGPKDTKPDESNPLKSSD
ncbi:hypothetical protein MMC25_004583 [Agyrium rufum]|nr:hypothetical protein [Agyrium rufum]